MHQLRSKISKSQVLTSIKNFLLITLGCTLLAFADAVFLVPCNIVSGGVSSIGIIVDYFVKQSFPNFDSVDIVVGALQVILFLIGLIVLGKKFSIHTLFASLIYPLILTLFYRLNVGSFITSELIPTTSGGVVNEDLSKTLLAGVFGGAFAGAGVACSFLGNGSTGGFDILSFIIAKYTDMKQDVSGFLIDGTIIVVGAVCMWQLPNEIPHALIGILSAITCAAAIQFIYIYSNSYVIADIISEHYQEIMDFIHNEMGHGTTLIDTVGGFTGEDRKLVRVAFNKIETGELRAFIAKVDPKAFVTFTQASTINGEGFVPFIVPKRKDRKISKPLVDRQYPKGMKETKDDVSNADEVKEKDAGGQ